MKTHCERPWFLKSLDRLFRDCKATD